VSSTTADKPTTATDPTSTEWAMADEVIRLRERGSMKFYPLRRHGLPDTDSDEPSLPASPSKLRIGAGMGSDLQLNDPQKRVSQNHGILFFEEAQWHVLDIGSKNGISLDGKKQPGGCLEPGTELGVGSLTLVAESVRYIELRCFLSRLLGWVGDAAEEAVDRAMQIIRWAQRRRTPIALVGNEDMVPIAHDLHHYIFGADKPFVLCDSKRQSRAEDARSVENIAEPRAALRAARGGTLCMRNERLPEEMEGILEEIRYSPGLLVQLVFCGKAERPIHVPSTEVISIPPLNKRDGDQVSHLIFEYFLEAERTLNARRRVSPAEQEWVRNNAISIGEVSKSTLRLTALRESTSLLEAADRLQMATVSLRRWIQRRPALPFAVVDDSPQEPDA
jgi:hypothetical protein